MPIIDDGSRVVKGKSVKKLNRSVAAAAALYIYELKTLRLRENLIGIQTMLIDATASREIRHE